MTLSIMGLLVILTKNDTHHDTTAIKYAEWNYAEWHYAECRYDECRYFECRYAECRYDECRGAVLKTSMVQ
jgi:hypothetical protein